MRAVNDGFGEGFRMPAGRDLSTGAAAGVRKPPRKEPAGAGWAACRLWGFGWVAAWVRVALAGVVPGADLVAVHFMYYNFVRIHQSLRNTPAMAAGVTQTLWSLIDIVRVIDAWEASRSKVSGDTLVE